MALNLCHLTGVLFLIVCDCLIYRYAATGACNIFVFVVTWIFLGTNEHSTSSNKLGSSDATAFMVNIIGQVVRRLKSPVVTLVCLNIQYVAGNQKRRKVSMNRKSKSTYFINYHSITIINLSPWFLYFCRETL